LAEKHTPTGVMDILKQGEDGLDDILRRAGALGEVSRVVRGVLPPAIADKVHVGNVRDGVLVLITATSAVASRLRLDGPRIKEALAEKGLPIQSVRAKVNPTFVPPPEAPPAEAPVPLSDHARNELLKAAAELGEESSALQRSLEQLANVGRAAKDRGDT